MSGWDSWVNALTNKKRVTTGGIYGQNGDLYAATPNFEPDANELKTIISCLSCGDSHPTSFTLSNRKFITISNVDGIIVGKCDKNIAAVGLGKTTCVVGMYIDGEAPKSSEEPRAPNVVEDVAVLLDHLVKSGY